MTQIIELADEVRILELEVKKIELENRITELKDERSIDECVGCAGPCKVVDVAADLQKELDSCQMLADSYKNGLENRDETIRKAHAIIEQQKTTIEELKVQVDAFPDNFFDVVAKRDEIIKQRETTIDELKDRNIDDLHELYDLYEAELNQVKSDSAIMLTNCRNVNARRETTIDDQKRTIDHFINHIGGLEAELSARKEDSAVLTKVVDAITMWNRSPIEPIRTISDIRMIIDAPEGSPETPIDETPDIAIVFTFGEIL